MNDIVRHTREKVMRMEAVLREYPQVELEVHHHFADGVYARELLIPAGVVLTGKIHRHKTMNFLMSGTIRVTTDDGIQELTGPLILNTEAGMKKAAYAVTDTIWVNIHPTESTDIEEIEHEFIVPEEELLEQEKNVCLG